MDWDLSFQMKAARIALQFWATQPVQSLVVGRSFPPLSTVPLNATYGEWMEWIKSAFTLNHHLIGIAAMLPLELGGVVDENLIVYGR
ncbi:hypothetical protein EYZ11_008265 [Aspergillus tanneri]|uniref:Uncharacterized protein n=1 Tax=Aspergillus tanneri TaxID=1220188 RepID=A0A4S3JD36_9EURO|nr:hypothetical protein EYZ11_008265 [Aspergillus tanneri]